MSTQSTYQPSMFQLRGRIGRARYLAYSFLLSLLLALCMMALTLVAGDSGTGFALVKALAILASLALTLVVGARRLQDLGRKPWIAACLLIPFVNIAVYLWLLFAPGSQGANDYGPPPGPNTRGVLAVAWAIPALFVAALVTAVVFAPHKSDAQRAREGMEQAL